MYYPTNDLVFFKLIVLRVFFSRSVFSQTSISARDLANSVSQQQSVVAGSRQQVGRYIQVHSIGTSQVRMIDVMYGNTSYNIIQIYYRLPASSQELDSTSPMVYSIIYIYIYTYINLYVLLTYMCIHIYIYIHMVYSSIILLLLLLSIYMYNIYIYIYQEPDSTGPMVAIPHRAAARARHPP